jgi:DNA-directed RNA polymerase specialized sigma24 family protein
VVDFNQVQSSIDCSMEVKMFGAKKAAKQDLTPYATRAHFCRIFENDLDRLYVLSLLLTGEQDLAEKCFIGGLHIAQEGNHVFKEWAESWARRAIIQNAIRLIRPRPADGIPRSLVSDPGVPVTTESPEAADIIALPAFARFVFVMSVLERYSDQECSLFLECTRGQVAAARSQAVQQIARSAELRHKVISIDAGHQEVRSGITPQFVLQGSSQLAVAFRH